MPYNRLLYITCTICAYNQHLTFFHSASSCFLIFFVVCERRAYASSAPIGYYSGEVPCGKFLKSVTAVFKSESESCAQSIRRIWNVLQSMASSSKYDMCTVHVFKREILSSFFSFI